MRRREFITLLGGAAGTWPFAARAQQPAMPVIGYFSVRSPETDVPMLAAFRRGLNQSGYVEGRNVALEFRWAMGQYDRLPALAEDLVRREVAVIVTGGGDNAALAAKRATTTIPIVFVGGDDPVRTGLVAGLNRPGGNLTGITSLLRTLGPKELGLLRQLVPRAAMICMLVNPNEPTAEFQIGSAQTAAQALGLQLVVLMASTEPEIDAAFTSLVQQRADALLVAAGPFFVTREKKIVELAAHHRVPTMYPRREFVEAGGLISYGSSTAENYHQVGIYAGKILSGAKPANLPVMQPTKFELVINLKTAKALGLTVPPGVLAIADEVIE